MVDNGSKVVKLSSAGGINSSGLDDPRIPAPFIAMKEKGKLGMQPLMQALFDNIDDALFELADRAEHNTEQNMYFESMREIRIKRRSMELGFGRELDEAFRQLHLKGAPPLLASSARVEEVSVDNLSLVDDDELEQLVAADGMIAKAEREYAPALKQLTTRLDTLFDAQAVTDKSNPLGPAIICQAFINVCRDLDLDIKAKLVLFKLFDRYVMSQLNAVYEVCNSVLAEGGILPSLEQRNQGRVDKSTRQAQQQGLGAESIVDSAQTASDVFSDLQDLLHRLPQSPVTASSGLVAPGVAPQIPRQTLMQLLHSVQQSLASQMEHQHQAALQGVVPEQLDVQASLSSLLQAKMPSRPMSIGQVDDDAINLVAMLFQFILDDRNLDAPMKALIARLQIPIIKLAMTDKTFFSKGGHPARKLLNEIANAGLGWTAGTNTDRDPLFNKISSVVSRLLNDSDGNSSLFQEVLQDFIAFMEMEKRRAGLVEQRIVNAEDGKAKSEVARNKVQDLLNEKVAGKSLPKVVVNLLEEAWSNVLFLICLKDGEEDSSWQEALQVVDDLLWSVEPMSGSESRQQLLVMLPELLKSLRAGLTKIGYNPFDMNQLFTDLELIHLAQLQQLNTVKLDLTAPVVNTEQTRVIEKTLDQMLEERGDNEVSLERLDAELDQQLAEFGALGDLVAQSADDGAATVDSGEAAEDGLARQRVEKLAVTGANVESGSQQVQDLDDDDPCLQQVDAMEMGVWVELHQEDGKKFRCRLAAIIRCSGKYIFVNRSGMKVAEYNRMGLAQAIKKGAVSALDEGLLFDRALESVIGNLRTMKATSA